MHTQTRQFSFDNLRTLMVLFIILLHALCAYSIATPWWHAQDIKNPLCDVVLITIDTFALPVLFFVSGIFATPSYDRHGPVEFIKEKLKRLGIPLVLLPTFYLPTMVYAGYLHRTAEPLGFFDYWLHWMSTVTDWSVALITNMETGARYADAFTPHHLWFISLLLVFFLGYAGWKALFPKAVKIYGIGRLTIAAWSCLFIGFSIISIMVQDWAWLRMGPFFLFQPTRLPVYLFMFIFGILARPHMDKEHPFPGPTWLWLIIFLIAQVGILVMARKVMTTPGPTPLVDSFAHGALRATLSITATCLFVNLLKRFMTGYSAWRQSLSASSYDIYLLHMPVTVFVQTLLIGMAIPISLKVLVVFLVPTTLFWGLSRLMAPRGYALPAGILAAYFLGFCLLL